MAQSANVAGDALQPAPPREEEKPHAEFEPEVSSAETESEAAPSVELRAELEPSAVELDAELKHAADLNFECVVKSPAELDPIADARSDCAVEVRSSRASDKTRDVCYVGVQIWRNKDFLKKKQAEWTAKLRWMVRFEPGVMEETYIGFRPSPRKARETTRRHAAEGKVSEAWAEKFADLTFDLDEATRVGPMSKRVYNTPKRQGASSNARESYEGCWGAMMLNSSGSGPQSLILHFFKEEIAFDKFTPANGQARNAAQWIALYDPDGLQTAKRDLARLRKNLAEGHKHNPNTALQELIAHHVKPLVDKLTDLNLQKLGLYEEIKKLRYQNTEMKSRLDGLADDVRALKRAAG